MKLDLRRTGKYFNVEVYINGDTIDLGLRTERERLQLGMKFFRCAEELLGDKYYLSMDLKGSDFFVGKMAYDD